MAVDSEYTQTYDATATEPVQVWVFCRLCRCRLQVRTVPRPALPFRCYCGHAATLSGFDVFQDEDEARRFAATFEDLYQTTKRLLREADMPAPPRTRLYTPDFLRRAVALDPEAAATENEPTFRSTLGRLREDAQRAPDGLARHDALVAVAEYAFERRNRYPEARARCLEACREDVDLARATVDDAARRKKRGEPVRLKFPTFRWLADLLEEQGDLEQALDVATRATALGLQGHEERMRRLRERVRPRT